MAYRSHPSSSGKGLDEGPTELNTREHSQFVELAKDRLTAEYTGKGNHAHDVGSIQANRPFPTDCIIAYYELTVVNAGKDGCIVIGIADKKFELNRQPGWEPNSFGYYGECGRKFSSGGIGEAYAEEYTTLDTVGCGICYPKQEVFFTKNGKYLGPAFTGVSGVFIPTIGLHSPSAAVWVNFGQEPFIFNIDELGMEYQEQHLQELASIPLKVSLPTQLIREYLLHYGYVKTLTALEESLGSDPAPPPIPASGPAKETLGLRAQLRQMIIAGQVAEAIEFLHSSFPSVFEDAAAAKRVMFALHCQQFVGLIKAGDVMQAIEFSRAHLDQYYGDASIDSDILTRHLSLVAYKDPADSEHGYLLRDGHAGEIADIVNNEILRTPGQEGRSRIEQVWKQIVVVDTALRAARGGTGEAIQLSQPPG